MALKRVSNRVRQKPQTGPKWPIFAFIMAMSVLKAQADVAYFLVASQLEHETNDSYVLPITKPEDIAEARRELTLDFTNRLNLVARIAAGVDGINRNFLAPGKPAWTWHVTEFLVFAEGTIEVLDGSPTLTEQRSTSWFHDESGAIDTKGAIGYAAYRLVAELTLEELFFSAAQPTPEGVKLSWLELGANYVYTVEASTSLSQANWVPAPGSSWPMSATNWVDTGAVTNQSRFYRVKADLKIP